MVYDGPEALLVYDTTNQALKSESALKGAGLKFAVIPTPLEVTADCGIAILIPGDSVQAAKQALSAAGCGGYTVLFPFPRGRR